MFQPTVKERQCLWGQGMWVGAGFHVGPFARLEKSATAVGNKPCQHSLSLATITGSLKVSRGHSGVTGHA